MLQTYRRAYALPGAWRFSSTGLVARLPIAMIGLGIVLLVSTTTGSYALAGALSACFQVSAALGAVATSRWTDRVGQDRLLPGLAIIHGLALSAFAMSVVWQVPLLVQVLLATLAGVAQPAIGSMVRARWATIATGPEELRSAFAVESIIDELVFSVGPLITALLAIQVALPLPLIVASVLVVAGSIVLSLQRSSQPDPHRGHHDGTPQRRGGAMGQPGMPVLVAVALGIGGVFGTYEVSVVAFTADADQPTASGWVLALWAFGSMLAGLVFGARHVRWPLPRQVLVLTAILTLVLVPASFVRTVPALAIVTFIAGAGVAPALIATFSLTERLVPARLLTEGLTWSNSGLALGFSGGSWLAGTVIDAYGTTVSFILPPLSAGTGALICLLGQRVLTRASRRPSEHALATPLNADPVPGPTPGGIIDDPE